MKTRYIMVGLIGCVCLIAYAQEKLPTELAGTGLSGTMRPSVAPWSIVIESQEADGVIAGTMSWSGRSCNFTNLPFTGTYRDGALELSAPETNPSKCGAWTIKMKRTGASEFNFEGTAQTSDPSPPVSVTLKPR